MTWSRQGVSRSAANKAGALTACPICGSRRIRRQTVDVRFADGLTLPDVEADCCPDCGERIYDSAAARRMTEMMRG